MDKRAEFSAALKEALHGRDEVKVATLRLIMAALKDRDINARTENKPDGISDSEILSMLQSMIKQRTESAETYRNADRMDLAVREEQEIAIIKSFLPQQMGEDEISSKIDALITETGASNIKDMGKVMAELKTRYAGQLDMSRASGMVKEKLG